MVHPANSHVRGRPGQFLQACYLIAVMKQIRCGMWELITDGINFVIYPYFCR